MKLRHLIQILIILFPINTQSQTWVFQQSGTTIDLHGVWFTDSLSGWCCGDSGIILHTSDGGETWLSQPSGVTVLLTDIFFQDTLNGWICADSGTIIHTTDGGSFWEKKNTNVTSCLRKIQFYSAADGVSSGERSTRLFTHDSGKTWTPFPSSDTGRTIILYYFIDKYRGIRYYFDSLMRGSTYITVDGGLWSYKGSPIYPINDIFGYRVYIGNLVENLYWLVGEHGYIEFLTVLQSNPFVSITYWGQTEDTLNLYSITLQPMGEYFSLWGVGDKGWIINSVDTGKSWQTLPSNTTANLNDISFPVGQVGWIVGNSGIILHYDKTSDVVETTNKLFPHFTFLSNAYPNPFNPSTQITYSVPKAINVTLKIYDVLGREIAVLVNERKQPGEYKVTWNAEGVPSGVYFYRIVAGEFAETKKMVFIR